MRSKRILSSDYDNFAQSYDAVRFGTYGGRYTDEVEKKFIKRSVNGHNALEIGTATGRFAVLLLNLGYEYTGIDLSLAMLEVTSDRTSFAADRTALLQMDVESMA